MKNSTIGWIAAIILGVILVVGTAYTISQKPAAAPTNTPEQKQTDTSADHSITNETVTITYTDDGFSPSSYMIKVGGTVTVVNNSSHDLEFSSDNHPTHTKETELNMDILKPGKSGTFTVTKVGTWGFHNHLRDQDTGSLMVM